MAETTQPLNSQMHFSASQYLRLNVVLYSPACTQGFGLSASLVEHDDIPFIEIKKTGVGIITARPGPPCKTTTEYRFGLP